MLEDGAGQLNSKPPQLKPNAKSSHTRSSIITNLPDKLKELFLQACHLSLISHFTHFTRPF
ncbi:hypothetical protein GW575_00020 [Campylobacter sp. MIT 19-121]|nr:hypothetical protein [Campylobacter sp. MIT 19-121]